MTTKTVIKFILAGCILIGLATAVCHAQTLPTIDGHAPIHRSTLAPNDPVPVYPGYWRCGNPGAGNFVECPCYFKPYTDFTDPYTGNTGFARYDASMMRLPQSCPGGGGTPPCLFASAGGPNHSTTWIDTDFHEKPMKAQQQPPNYYPAPQAPTALCPTWTANGNTSACPGTDYVSKMNVNATFHAGYLYFKPFMDADPGCNGSVPTPTKTPTLPPIPTVTPGPPPPNQFATQIEAVWRAGITAGCGNGKFCPDRVMTRGEVAAWIANALKLPLLPCVGVFTDVTCPVLP